MTLCRCKDIIKDREICFTCSTDNADQVEKAARLLADINGIELATPTQTNVLRVRYDVREITLQMLESALKDVGFDLHNTLSMHLKRGMIAYCEGTMRSRLGIETDQQEPLMLRKTVGHHNLDPRPNHWRNYI
ncbi:MAG: hypothetical protein OQK32_06725 [Gammaproteobacteria bacterium]|nr:hypothetical protein [Gammaproteobacteria bacterium]MCW8923992.1 hypothetical protein [Gammaproteobacteria bacterium]